MQYTVDMNAPLPEMRRITAIERSMAQKAAEVKLKEMDPISESRSRRKAKKPEAQEYFEEEAVKIGEDRAAILASIKIPPQAQQVRMDANLLEKAQAKLEQESVSASASAALEVRREKERNKLRAFLYAKEEERKAK